jgi:hypothetical protein
LDGSDGFSPIVSVKDISGGHRVTITDKEGAKTFDVMDGKDGTGGSGGGAVQSDWNQNDSTKPDYIKNRTHYEVPPAFEPIRWDGNMDGHFALDMSALGYEEGLYYVKVSDLVPVVDKIVGSTISLNTGDEVIVSDDNIITDEFPGAYLVGEYLVIVQEQSLLNAALGLPDGYITNGIYFMSMSGAVYVSKLTDSNAKVVKIDKKFLPDAVQPDWNQNDESQPDYVKNRPFYEVPTNYEITWDGDMEGRTVFDLSVVGADGAYLVKVSDRVYTKEELVWRRFLDSDGYVSTINQDSFIEAAPGSFMESGFSFAVVNSADEFNAAVGAPDGYFTNGTYFLAVPSTGIYVSAIYTDGRLVKLEEKYLPDTTLRKNSIDFGVALVCEIDAGFSDFYINIPSSDIDNLRERLAGNIVSAFVTIKSGSVVSNAYGCFLMNGDMNKCIGSCYVVWDSKIIAPKYIQIFLDVRPGLRSVRVAAKTVDI